MILAEISTYLRDQSDRYGGIKDFLSAAGDLDRAASEFMKAQDIASLAVLNGAVAHAWRHYATARKEVGKGPVAR